MINLNFKVVALKHESTLLKAIHQPNSINVIPLETSIAAAKQYPRVFLQKVPFAQNILSLPVANDGKPNKIRIPRDGSFIWVRGRVGPCLFMSIAIKNEQGHYTEAAYGHFSAIVTASIYRTFCDAIIDESHKSPSDIRLAGYTGRSSETTLRTSVEHLCETLGEKGINLTCEFPNQRAVVTHVDSGKVISDLGLDIDWERKLGRFILWGISRDVNIMFSFLLEPKTNSLELVTVIL